MRLNTARRLLCPAVTCRAPGAAHAITTAHVPKIAATPVAADTIGIGGGTMTVPE
jgi:hypothetical protein